MTRYFLYILLLSLFTLSLTQSFAQVPSQTSYRDSLFWVKAEPSRFYEAGDLNILEGDFTAFGLPDLRQLTASTAQKLQVPASAQSSNGPLYITNKLKCLKISSPKGKQGRIVWWDRNGDKLIQPLRELRCISPNGNANKVFVEEVSCK